MKKHEIGSNEYLSKKGLEIIVTEVWLEIAHQLCAECIRLSLWLLTSQSFAKTIDFYAQNFHNPECSQSTFNKQFIIAQNIFDFFKNLSCCLSM